MTVPARLSTAEKCIARDAFLAIGKACCSCDYALIDIRIPKLLTTQVLNLNRLVLLFVDMCKILDKGQTI